MRVGRAFTVVWGLRRWAWPWSRAGRRLGAEGGLAALGYASGPTVGAFLLGVLTDAGHHRGP